MQWTDTPFAAIPNYLGTDFTHASPGMRFGMYFKLWDAGWSKSNDRPLDNAKCLNTNDQKTMRALLDRQKQAFNVSAASAASLRLEALATAPFTTGLGNEHPLENGFAFLNPYGLPYLSGSGVKGVLRHAARELAGSEWDDTSGWSEKKTILLMQGEGDKRLLLHDKNKQPMVLSMLDVLFGHETAGGDSGHVRGALTFWDVIPQIAPENPNKPDKISLAVDIMTPHQSHYYQNKSDRKAGNSTTPHESGQPNPITFLTVPPGSSFVFHVQCDLVHLARLAPELVESGRWKTLLTVAFNHAFKWLGFGAKTAVGYGAMVEDPEALKRRQKQVDDDRLEAERQAQAVRLAKMSPDDRAFAENTPVIEQFREQFAAARKTPYRPGSTFDSQRNAFMKKAQSWKDLRRRKFAAELLEQTLTKSLGPPSNKESKQRLKELVEQLKSA